MHPLGSSPARAILALAVAVIPACSSGGGSAPDPEAGRVVASAFLDDIRAGKVDAAWAGTTAEFKSMLGLEGLRAYVRKNPAAREPAEFVACVPRPANGLDLAEASFRSSSKAPKTLKVLLGKQDGAWKVERFAIE